MSMYNAQCTYNQGARWTLSSSQDVISHAPPALLPVYRRIGRVALRPASARAKLLETVKLEIRKKARDYLHVGPVNIKLNQVSAEGLSLFF